MFEFLLSSYDSRGQAHTTEAILASMLILLAVLFALQTTAVTPFSAMTTDKHLENQQREEISNTIQIAQNNGNLKQTILNWESSQEQQDGSAGRENPDDVTYYTNMDAETAFLEQLNQTVDTSQSAYNVNLRYYNSTDEVRSQRLLRVGSPSDNVVVVRKPITLHDTDRLTTDPTTRLQETDDDEFYIPSLDDSTRMYNYVEVEVVIWRR